jgi:hypothetical protein
MRSYYCGDNSKNAHSISRIRKSSVKDQMNSTGGTVLDAVGTGIG